MDKEPTVSWPCSTSRKSLECICERKTAGHQWRLVLTLMLARRQNTDLNRPRNRPKVPPYRIHTPTQTKAPTWLWEAQQEREECPRKQNCYRAGRKNESCPCKSKGDTTWCQHNIHEYGARGQYLSRTHLTMILMSWEVGWYHVSHRRPRVLYSSPRLYWGLSQAKSLFFWQSNQFCKECVKDGTAKSCLKTRVMGGQWHRWENYGTCSMHVDWEITRSGRYHPENFALEDD